MRVVILGSDSQKDQSRHFDLRGESLLIEGEGYLEVVVVVDLMRD